MPLESTEKYQSQLSEIRKLPQENAEQKAEKKEVARRFRMEVMLDNARLMEKLTAQFEYNPWATKQDLEESVEIQREYLAHPVAADQFLNDLVVAKLEVESAIEELESNSKSTKSFKSPEAILFDRLVFIQKHQYSSPKGRIKIDKSYPLAVLLFVENEEDFKMVHNVENIGGFYRAKNLLYPSTPADSPRFPLIVVKGTRAEFERAGVTEEHEKGHAENKRFASSLTRTERRAVWLDTDDLKKHTDVSRLLVYAQSPKYGKDIREGKEKPREWRDVLDYALERAKDELLAELKATGSIKHYLQYLEKRGGVYDYFGQLGIDSDHDPAVISLYNDLWTEYVNDLKFAVDTIETLFEAYRKFGLKERAELMRWVLAQFPLKDWPLQIIESAFFEEATRLNQVYHLFETGGGSTIASDPYRRFTESIRNNQGRSFLPAIDEFSKDTIYAEKKTQEEREAQRLTDFKIASSGIFFEVKAGRLDRWEAERKLLDVFVRLCEKHFLLFDHPSYLSYLYKEGWITEEEYKKRLDSWDSTKRK